jgi:NADPH:quinone reductase-like Zn-dependent oxidoreductase
MSSKLEQLARLSPQQRLTLLQQLKPGILRAVSAGGAAADTPSTAVLGRASYRPGIDPNFRVSIGSPGVLTSLRFEVVEREPVAANQVEVEVHSASMNFRDVAIALGMYPQTGGVSPPALGWDYAGVVTRVGRDAARFHVGQEVMGMADQVKGCYRQYITAEETWILPKPAHLSFDEAAASVAVLTTAYYSLVEVGRLSSGERVLIHCAAGGVGLAAIQIAQWVGAEIYATTSSTEKSDYLRSIGVHQIMSSRSLDFIDEVLALTDNEGVDLILNSLPGDAIRRGLTLLRPCGRFIELGRRDIIENTPLGLGLFSKAILFSTVNIAFGEQMRKRIYTGINHLIESRIFKPLPMKVYPISAIAEACAGLSSGRHIGKTVLRIKDVPIPIAKH